MTVLTCFGKSRTVGFVVKFEDLGTMIVITFHADQFDNRSKLIQHRPNLQIFLCFTVFTKPSDSFWITPAWSPCLGHTDWFCIGLLLPVMKTRFAQQNLLQICTTPVRFVLSWSIAIKTRCENWPNSWLPRGGFVGIPACTYFCVPRMV